MRIAVASVLLACCLAVPAGAATSKPKFAKTYRGTVSGTTSTRANGQTLDTNWTITGVVFRLKSIRAFEGGWTGIYKVGGGKVSFNVSGSEQDCSYVAHEVFKLAGSLPKHAVSVPFALDKNPLGHYSIMGLLDPSKRIAATEFCTDSDSGQKQTSTKQIDVPDLLNAGEKGWKPGRAIKGSNAQRDSFDDTKSSRTWRWNLKPAS